MKPQTFHELLRKSIIEKFNPYHDRLGRFSSANGASSFSASPNTKAGQAAIQREAERNPLVGAAYGAAGRNYGKSNCEDAVSEINSKRQKEANGEKVFKDADGNYNSLQAHMDKDGNLSPEREQIHKEIIDNWLAGKTGVEGQAEMRMMGGGPAAGKSSVEKAGLISKYDEKHHATIDPDYFKEQLPGYKDMTKQTDQAASFFHEESSLLAKRAYEVALSENINVTYDGTGDGSMNSVTKKINAARAKGYKVTGEYVTIDTDEAIRRNQKRYDDAKAAGKPARKPPEAYVRNCHAKVTNISVEAAPLFDTIRVWDNNGAKGSTKLIAQGGNGKGLTAVKGEEAAFNKYLAKGK